MVRERRPFWLSRNLPCPSGARQFGRSAFNLATLRSPAALHGAKRSTNRRLHRTGGTIVHAGCLEVEETMKSSMPHFDYKGVLCGIAAHKEHCSLGFWKGALNLRRRAPRWGECDGAIRPHHCSRRFNAVRRFARLRAESSLVERSRCEIAGAESEESAGRDAQLFHRRTREEQAGASGFREIQPEPAAGIRRVGDGSQARSDARSTARDCRGMDRGRQRRGTGNTRRSEASAARPRSAF